MPEKTKVLIVDDHPVVIQGITNIIEDDPDFEVVGSVKDSRQALSTMESLEPDIVTLDVLMPHMDGVEVTRQIREKNSDTRILIYTMSALKENIIALFRMGISGYVLKEEPFSELIMALKVLREGATFYSETVRKILQDHLTDLELGEGKDVEEVRDGIARLSTREKEVFVLLADGLTTREVADRLCISPKTVESHKYNIMEKLDLKSIAEFTKIAARKGLIEL